MNRRTFFGELAGTAAAVAAVAPVDVPVAPKPDVIQFERSCMVTSSPASVAQ